MTIPFYAKSETNQGYIYMDTLHDGVYILKLKKD